MPFGLLKNVAGAVETAIGSFSGLKRSRRSFEEEVSDRLRKHFEQEQQQRSVAPFFHSDDGRTSSCGTTIGNVSLPESNVADGRTLVARGNGGGEASAILERTSISSC